MKKFILTAIFAIMIAGQTLAIESPVSMTPTGSTATHRQTSVKTIFQSAIGQYPSDINLLTKPAIKKRLIKLLGQSRYNTMVKNFDVQVPIEFANWNYQTWGAQAHSCGYNEFQISYNPKQDALAVKYIWEGKAKVFKEKPSVNAYWDY